MDSWANRLRAALATEGTSHEDPDALRLFVFVRKDLFNAATALTHGPKFLGQAGHAVEGALLAALEQTPGVALAYLQSHLRTKIVLGVKNLDALERAHREAQAAGLPAALVTDAAKTLFLKPTVTCLGVGPCRPDGLPPFLARQRLLHFTAPETTP